jgi:DNA-binding NtrC family response regulator
MLEVLVGDDDVGTRRRLAAALHGAGHRVLEASDGQEAMGLTAEHVFDVVVCEVGLPRVDGLTVFRHLRRESPNTAIILTSAAPRVIDAVAALKEGALDFLTKPYDEIELARVAIGRIAERRALRQAFDEARAWLVGRIVGAALIGSSPPMVRLLERLDTVAQSECAVLVAGETGTGKDILARTLYARSRRAARPFVSVDCARRPVELLEHELFGDAGQLASARGGTVFFDEIGELPLSVQAKLVRVLQDGARDGTSPLDVRLISATHHDLKEMIRASQFREDLYYRLNVLDLTIPPLRERKGDLPILLHHFLERLTPPGQVAPGVSPCAWAALAEYAFPGNVRELARAVEHALALAHGCEIDVSHLPPEIAGAIARAQDGKPLAPLTIARGEFEREYLLRTLKLCSGDIERAAQMLGIQRASLVRKLRRHGVGDLTANGRTSIYPPPVRSTMRPSAISGAPLAASAPTGSSARSYSVPPGSLGVVKAGVRPGDELRPRGVGLELGERSDADADSYAELRAREMNG